jgi:hypothetical protein
VDENGVVHLTGTYTDQGTQDTHSLTINWGEGAPQTVALSGGSFDITHQYLDDNPTGTPSDQYTIGVTLTDDDTGSVTGSTTTTITNVAPLITSLGATSTDDDTGSVAGSTTTTVPNVAPGGAKSSNPGFPVTDVEPSPFVWTISSAPLGTVEQTSTAGGATTTGPGGPEIGGVPAVLSGIAARGAFAGSSPEPELWSGTAATPIAAIEEPVGLYGFAEQLGAGKVLVFNLDDFHYTDLCTDSVVFAQRPGATQLTGLAGYLAGVKAGKALVFNLDDIVSFDLLSA